MYFSCFVWFVVECFLLAFVLRVCNFLGLVWFRLFCSVLRLLGLVYLFMNFFGFVFLFSWFVRFAYEFFGFIFVCLQCNVIFELDTTYWVKLRILEFFFH
jgi:hypothetical protein